jgi:7-cyano-7-deazaguanine synthase in queuosine biosynthesis
VMVRTYIDALSAGHDSTTALVLARNAGQIMEQAEGRKVTEITAS